MKHTHFTTPAVCSVFLTIFVSSLAFGINRDDPNSMNTELAWAASGFEVTAELDEPDAAYLVYEAGNSMDEVMDAIGADNVRLRSAADPITASDWAWCDILVVGGNSAGFSNYSGIDPNEVGDYITGRVLLTGHDADQHAADDNAFAKTFLIQAINYALAGEAGKCAVGCGDTKVGFEWTPLLWGLDFTKDLETDTIKSFTDAGLDSGVYDNLTPEFMSGWNMSYHVYFNDYSSSFVPFEIGNYGGDRDVTIACSTNPLGFELTKEDDIDTGQCRGLNEEIEYTISWHNATNLTLAEAYIIDFLPPGVSYPAGLATIDPNTFVISPADPNYIQSANAGNTYRWDIPGPIYPDDSGQVTLTVVVNDQSPSGMFVHNVAQFWGDGLLLAQAELDSSICCWDTGTIIYVDENAQGNENGQDWANAYTTLTEALDKAANSLCQTTFDIYVAQGTYIVSKRATDSFVLPDNTYVYGGFKTGGCEFADRNPDRYKTILNGQIDSSNRTEKLVVMGDETLLDGFTVTSADQYGIYGDEADFTVENCIIENCKFDGINAQDGNVTLRWSSISYNGLYGIYHSGNNELIIENCQIENNNRYGIYSIDSIPTIKNSVIFSNGYDEDGFEGINIVMPSDQPVLYNNTIISNRKAGVSFIDSDPNDLTNPASLDLQNCIVYHNGDEQLTGIDIDSVAFYCCIADCNEVNGNFNDLPEFAYTTEPNNLPDPNNPYHLAWDSACKNAGNPSFSIVDVGDDDIDAESRIAGGRIDVGADELYSCDNDLSADDIYHPLDWNADGVINLHEFKPFSVAWLSRDPYEFGDPGLADPNEYANWEPKCNLADTGDSQYAIDLADLDSFLDGWLWIACWKEAQLNRFETVSAQLSAPMSASMMASPMMMSMDATGSVSVEPEPEVPVDTYVQVISFLDDILAESTDNVGNIESIRAILMGELKVAIKAEKH